ncbi:hypothetical protein LCGC14_0366520, partial [marine sediment metagenome]
MAQDTFVRVLVRDAVIFNPVVHFTAFKQPIYSARFPAIC